MTDLSHKIYLLPLVNAILDFEIQGHKREQRNVVFHNV